MINKNDIKLDTNKRQKNKPQIKMQQQTNDQDKGPSNKYVTVNIVNKGIINMVDHSRGSRARSCNLQSGWDLDRSYSLE